MQNRKSPFQTPFPNMQPQPQPQQQQQPQFSQQPPMQSQQPIPPPSKPTLPPSSQTLPPSSKPLSQYNYPPSSSEKPSQSAPFKESRHYYTNETKKSEFDLLKSEWESQYLPYNSSPINIRPTTSVFPSNPSLLKEISFPIGLSITPISSNDPYQPVPLINYGESTIPRCPSNNCRAYLNPFVKFINGGDKWVCNFCGQINTTEDHYYDKLDANGRRVDIGQKVELTYGSYEFITNKQYWKTNKTPTEAFFIFIIETSMSAVQSGFLSSVLESIKDVVANNYFYNGEQTKCAFITYDTSTNFYAFNEQSSQPQILCVTEEPVFLPTLNKRLILSMSQDKDKILTVIDLIQSTYNVNNAHNITCKDSVKMFSALNGAFLLAKGIGGKIIYFSASNALTSIPQMNGDNSNNNNKKQERTREQLAYSCNDNKKISTMGINLTNENTSCDVFATAEYPINVLMLNQLCEYSNGNIYFYKKFNIELHYKNIYNQIRRVLSRPISWEGVLRTRFSHGYKLTEFVTPVLVTNRDLLVFPTNDSDQHYQFGVTMNDINDSSSSYSKDPTINDKYVYIQSALLYSYGDGSRRIRVHNLCLPVSDHAEHIYANIDSEVLATHYLKSTIDKLYKTQNIANAIIYTESLFKTFISNVLSSKSSSKKELDDNLKALPLYILGMIKHRIFCKDELEKKYDIDLSNYLRLKLQKTSIEEIMCYIYPRIYPLHGMLDDHSLGTYVNDNEELNLPEIVNAHSESLEINGVYLIDNGYLLVLYLRYGSDKEFYKSLFGVDSLDFLTMVVNEESVFKEMDPLKERIMNVIDYIRSTKSIFQNLIFVFEGKEGERIVKESLIEDNFCHWYTLDYKTFYNRNVSSNRYGGYK